LASAVRPHNSALLDEIVSNASSTVEITVSSTEIGNSFFRAGDEVPSPGSYWVWHKKHRSVHAAKVRFTTFPACKQCGESVRYIPIDGEKSTATEWLRRDPDFRYALIRKGKIKT